MEELAWPHSDYEAILTEGILSAHNDFPGIKALALQNVFPMHLLSYWTSQEHGEVGRAGVIILYYR